MERPELEYVGFWPRLGASLIDTVLVIALQYPVLHLVYGPGYWTSEQFVQGPADLLISWVLPAVASVWLWVVTGQTPGKMAIGARIVDARTGRNLSIGRAVARYLAYFVSALGLFIGYVWVGLDPKKRGWHDHLAGSVVIRKRDRRPEPVAFDQ